MELTRILMVTILSAFFSGFIIFCAYKIAKYLYQHSDWIKWYMNDKRRGDWYLDDFWGILPLAFILIGLVLLILYPIFWFLLMIILVTHKNDESK